MPINIYSVQAKAYNGLRTVVCPKSGEESGIWGIASLEEIGCVPGMISREIVENFIIAFLISTVDFFINAIITKNFFRCYDVFF